jgi:hypothetical protein
MSFVWFAADRALCDCIYTLATQRRSFDSRAQKLVQLEEGLIRDEEAVGHTLMTPRTARRCDPQEGQCAGREQEALIAGESVAAKVPTMSPHSPGRCGPRSSPANPASRKSLIRQVRNLRW